MNSFKILLFTFIFAVGSEAFAHFDTIPDGFRLKYSDFGANTDTGVTSPLLNETYNHITSSDCLPTDLQMISVGLYDYRYETTWSGNVKDVAVFKKRICDAEGRKALVQFGLITNNPNLRVRLISPSGVEVPLKMDQYRTKSNQYRITKDFSKIGSTVGDYGKAGDVRGEAGEWILELSADTPTKIERLSWSTHSLFWLLFPN